MNKTQKQRQMVAAMIATPADAKNAPHLADELRGLAASLDIPAFRTAGQGTADLVAVARTVASARRELDRAIGTAWLTDPALEVLLRAFLSEHPGAQTGSEAALDAVPHTAKRWVVMLEQAGLLVEGGRLDALHLTSTGREALCRYLSALSGRGPV